MITIYNIKTFGKHASIWNMKFEASNSRGRRHETLGMILYPNKYVSMS